MEFTNVLKSVQPEFAKYVIYCSEEIGTIRKVSQKYPLVYEVIQTLSRCESICGIIRISAISVQQRKLLAELSQGKTVTLSEIQAIYHKTIFLKHLTNSLPPNIDIQNDKITLQENVAEVLLSILKQIQNLIRKPTRKLTETNISSDEDHFNCFPALHQNFK